MPRALKVYRTAIGFHDAYVAAPSQKAALAAWGTGKNLFARGAAEIVTDPALTKAPLAKAGEVIRVMRGSAADNVKALGKSARSKAKPARKPQSQPPTGKPKRPPKPSREAVRLAEERMRAAEKQAARRLAELAAREKSLAAERRKFERELSAERLRHETRLREAEDAYERELGIWTKSHARQT